MKIVAVVPMKLNSERLQNKNILPFDNGEPLCRYILNTLKQVESLDEIYVYCSNPDIKNYIPDGIKYLTRSTQLDTSKTKINEVLSAFAADVPADIYLMTHTTAPFISAQSIQKGIEAVTSNKYDSAFSVKLVQDFMWKDGKPFNYDLDNIPRTQDLDPMYEETSGFYIYRSDIITKLNRRIGNNPCLVEISGIECIDIDEKEDFDIANAIFNFCVRSK